MSDENIKIRAFKQSDIDAVCRLAAELNLSQWSAEDYLAELQRTDSLMLTAISKKGGFVGFIVGRFVPASSSLAGYDAEIYNVGVDPKSQRTGVGSSLLDTFLKKTTEKEVLEIWLEVRAANHRAIEFYEKFGFEPVFKRASFYQNPPDDGLVMKLDLQRAAN